MCGATNDTPKPWEEDPELRQELRDSCLVQCKLKYKAKNLEVCKENGVLYVHPCLQECDKFREKGDVITIERYRCDPDTYQPMTE